MALSAVDAPLAAALAPVLGAASVYQPAARCPQGHVNRVRFEDLDLLMYEPAPVGAVCLACWDAAGRPAELAEHKSDGAWHPDWRIPPGPEPVAFHQFAVGWPLFERWCSNRVDLHVVRDGDGWQARLTDGSAVGESARQPTAWAAVVDAWARLLGVDAAANAS